MYTAQRKSVSGRVATFVGVSDFVRDLHLGHGFFGSAGLTTVIHNPGPTRRALPVLASHQTGPLRLGFLGRLEAAKGIEGLLATLHPMTGDFVLRIGGTGSAAFIDRLKARYADPRFEWLGRVEPIGFFSTIDALVVPSIWNEPCCLVIGESHSQGVPVIASRRGGIPEIVRNGDDGFIYEPNHPNELAEIVARLLADRSIVAKMSAAIMAQPPGLGVDDWAGAYAGLYKRMRSHTAQTLAAE
jgi:glycosyltransferase involved in cell wall biosynthesis